ncbi:ATP synthase subunit G atp20 [Elasticomyces elasticus]|nr:ATP synthase subunit G atp20 [Elasticomyces elasticus]KAK3629599.1 ATP synthase subunit G atp20 [Elasticomyces elasticus]KAK4890122.1 ATP synthase subunit G atp20 [Elasticomyces elasticus]KAK4919705.1 ATP synthase subunit G atp20 [Elasticomyces elasticus]KAK5678681.1 ATP synthase subunit G atp20 [Elasticomyces elasticus]
MSARLVRLPLRQSRFLVQRRAASTATEAASNTAAKAKDTASEVAGKAQQGLSRVTSSAGGAVGGAAERASQAVSGIGGRAGAVIRFAQGLVPPTVYYARVVGELGKLMFQGRNMSPPTMQSIQSYLTPVQNALRNPSALMNQTQSQANQAAGQAAKVAENPDALMSRLRNFDSGAMASVGVIAAEVLGFFTVGEMLGRFKIIGYRSGEVPAHH